MLAGGQTYAETFALSQKAPQYLKRASSLSPALASTILSSESSQSWVAYEQLLLSCLRAGDDRSAYLCLQRLIQRFGSGNERVMGLGGMYQEAIATGIKPLEELLWEFDKTLSQNPINTPVAKRRIALLRTLNRSQDAIRALVELLDLSPIDAEAWSELSDLYLSLYMYKQAIYCLEEVLLLSPNAWNIHARIGEILYISSTLVGDAEHANLKNLFDAFKRYCRSVELCDDYLRGYYGLKKTSDRLLENYKRNKTHFMEDPTMPSAKVIRDLNESVRTRIADIVRERPKGIKESEISASKELLDVHVQISIE